jgi:hypothetical protein
MSNINIPTQVSPFSNFAQFPAVGKIRVIYIDKATNTPYYWNDVTTTYVSLAGASSVDWGSIGGDILDQTDLQNALSGKVDKVTGKGLSTNDYTTVEKSKLAGIEPGAEVNVNADWNATSGDAQILNKPTIPTAVTKTSDLTNDGADGINPFITAGDIPTFASADKMVTVGRNSTGATLYKGTIVYISGSTGNRPNFVKSQANAESTSAGTFGVIESDIPNNSDGNCVTIGTIENLDTRSTATHPFTNDTLLDGDTIYLSPTTAGFVTKVKPSAPNHMVYVGKVVRTSPTNGTIVYRIQNGYELDEIHDVTTTNYSTPQDVDSLLILDNSTSLWKRLTWANLKATAKTYFDTLYQSILVSGTNIKTINGSSVLGSGNLTISGGITSVNTFSPLASTGGSTPTLSISESSASGDGYLNSTDWSTFNGKQESLVSGTNIKTINSTSVLGSGNIAVQPTLVSGTNIKTINGNSVLGSGDLTISGGSGLQGIHSLLFVTSGNWTNQMIVGGTPSSTISQQNRVVISPYIPAQNITTQSLTINCTTLVAGALVRLLIYSDSNGLPNTKLYESTDLDCSTTGLKTVSTTFNFVAGTTYWIGYYGNQAPTLTNMVIGSMMSLQKTNATPSTNNFVSINDVCTFGSAPSTYNLGFGFAVTTNVLTYIRKA